VGSNVFIHKLKTRLFTQTFDINMTKSGLACVYGVYCV